MEEEEEDGVDVLVMVVFLFLLGLIPCVVVAWCFLSHGATPPRELL